MDWEELKQFPGWEQSKLTFDLQDPSVDEEQEEEDMEHHSSEEHNQAANQDE